MLSFRCFYQNEKGHLYYPDSCYSEFLPNRKRPFIFSGQLSFGIFTKPEKSNLYFPSRLLCGFFYQTGEKPFMFSGQTLLSEFFTKPKKHLSFPGRVFIKIFYCTYLQTAVLDLINFSLSELRRLNPHLLVDELTVENAISR